LLKIAGTEPRQPLKHAEKKFDSTLAAKHPLRILLAEDNPVNQQVGLLMLSRLGYNADLAPDGQRALNVVEKAEYDLILMDIQMPNMNGIDAARIIREKLGAKCPAIFALTAEALEGDKQRFLDLGFDGYLSKPLQTHTLKDTLKTINSNSRFAKGRDVASKNEEKDRDLAGPTIRGLLK
jgi:CheY-like chemotaxis protein